MRVANPSYPNFLDTNDPEFKTFTTTLDNLFKDLRSRGVGAASSHTEGISSEDEKKLWDSNVLNIQTPKGLLRAVFFYCGKCFVSVGDKSTDPWPFRNWNGSVIRTTTYIEKMLLRTSKGDFAKYD